MLYRFKTAFKRLATPAAAAWMLLVPMAGEGWCQAVGAATVTASSLNVRREPGRQSPKIAVLDKGSRVTVLAKDGEWLKISCRDISGYIINDDRYIRMEDPDEQIEQLRKTAEALEEKIQSHKSDLAQYTCKETEIIERLNEIDLARDDLNRRIADLRRKIGAIQETMRENRETARSLEEKIKKTGDCACDRLIALYKLNLMGKLNILGAAGSVYEFLRTRKDMTIICEHDIDMLSRHFQSEEELKAVTARLAAEETEKAALEKTMQQQIAAMGVEKDKRQAILKDIRREGSVRKAALASLEKAADDLDQTIVSLYKKNENRRQFQGSFTALKGLLPMPVSGQIINEFGKYRDEDLKIVNFRSGIDIRAERGEPVRAVFRGEVLFAQWFKGYGNMMIIDHGEKYYTVYAHVQELFKKQGDLVETNEVVATVGDTTALSNETALYFELRHHGKPVDPLAWLNTG